MADYNKLKVAELREVLKERGIPSTGLTRKQQIIDALEAHDATQPRESAADAALDAEVTEQILDAEGVSNGGDHVAARSEDMLEGDAQGDVNGSLEGKTETGSIEVAEPGVAMPEDSGDLATEPAAQTVEVPSTTAADVGALPTTEDERREAPPVTPPQTSPGLERQSSETRKRKRRSPSPLPSEDSVNKKLKAAMDELNKLEEDDVIKDAPIPRDPDSEAAKATKVLPYGTSDDVMRIDSEPAAADTTSDPPDPPQDIQNQEMESQVEAETRHASPPVDEDLSGPPSIHPATRSLYIRDLLRPLQPQQLRDHIIGLAARPGEIPNASSVTNFHLDNIRTHAFVTFASASAASHVRAALHGQVWPDESTRKQLWVDYVPDEKVQEWIDRELDSINNKRDVRRWEVEYDTLNDGTVTTSLQEITAPTGPRPHPQSRAAVQASGVMGAPTGPRGQRPSVPSVQPQLPEPRAMRTPTPATNNATSSSFATLDERFSSTVAKPKIYYLPVSAELAEKRLDEIDRATSSTWEGGRAMKRASAVEQQLRRYTFEEGERIVDVGVDAAFGYRGPGGGRGGYRGDGYRGGGGGYGGGGGGYGGGRGRGWR